MLSFFTNNKTAIIVVGIIAFGIGCFSFGYDKAETEYLLKIESMKNDQKALIIQTQNEAREKYEAAQKILVAKYAANAERDALRLRELEAKLNTSGDLETVTRERNRALSIAVGLEQVAERAVSIAESMNEQ